MQNLEHFRTICILRVDLPRHQNNLQSLESRKTSSRQFSLCAIMGHGQFEIKSFILHICFLA